MINTNVVTWRLIDQSVMVYVRHVSGLRHTSKCHISPPILFQSPLISNKKLNLIFSPFAAAAAALVVDNHSDSDFPNFEDFNHGSLTCPPTCRAVRIHLRMGFLFILITSFGFLRSKFGF